MGFYTNTVLQSYTDYIGNDETNLLDKLATREWLATNTSELVEKRKIFEIHFPFKIESDVHGRTDRQTNTHREMESRPKHSLGRLKIS